MKYIDTNLLKLNNKKKNKPVSGFLTCDYEEYKPETFEGFSLYVNNQRMLKFEDKDPVIALELAFDFIHEYQRQKQLGGVTFSSQIDNFLMDSEEFDYVFDKNDGVIGLKLKKGKKLGKYKGKSNKHTECIIGIIRTGKQ